MASRSPVPDDIRQAYIDEGLRLRAEGKSQPDLEFGGQKYFLDNKGEKWGGWRLRNRGSHSAQGSKRRAMQRDAVPTKQDYQEVYGKRRGAQLFQQYKKDMARIWATRGTIRMDVDHMNSLASGGIEHPLNLRLQESSRNRSEGARVLTPEQKNALMLADTKKDQISVQGPKTTPRQRQQILDPKPKPKKIVTKRGGIAFRDVISNSSAIDSTLGGFGMPGDDNPFGGRTIEADPLFAELHSVYHNL